MQINPKLVVVILVVLVIVFIVATVIGLARDDKGSLNLDFVDSLGNTLADTFLSGVSIDIREIKIARGQQTSCLNKVTRIAEVPGGGACQYNIEPSSAAVRNLSFKLLAGYCIQVVLDNAAGDALRTDLHIVAPDLPEGSFDPESKCSQPDDPKLAIFEQSGDILTVTCVEPGDAGVCTVEFNPEPDKEQGG